MTMKTQTGRKLFKRSTIAACVMAATAAHVQAQEANSDDPALLEEVVVYGIKQSLQNAQDIKREAATVQDVITSSDIGALPDKSIVEALQRVPGVAIERFAASNDPDHFSVEGGSVTVRGLNRTRAEFNGRDTFSASGGGGLNYSDIPPEMVGSVIVNKAQEARITEGGIAGTINLITRKPFDKEELVLGATVKAGYGDLSEEVDPSASAVLSNVWDTDAGKFGALLGLSASKYTSRGDGVGVFNYKPVTSDLASPNGNFLYAPLGGAARQQFNDRDRLGVAGSLQWANPKESVQATLELLHSSSSLTWTERWLEFPGEPFAERSDANPDNFTSTSATYDCADPLNINFQPCTFTSGLIPGGYGGDADALGRFKGNPFYTSATRTQQSERKITDVSFNLEFAPNENLTLTGDAQYIIATEEVEDMAAHLRMNTADAYLDLRHSDNARFEILQNENGFGATDPRSYFMRSAMDQARDNEGKEAALQFDAKYEFDDGFITSVETGIRASSREADFKDTKYNWGSISETWMGTPATADTFMNSGLVEEFTFEDHLKGNALQLNNTFLMPSASALEDSNAFYQRAQDAGATLGGGTWRPLNLRPSTATDDGMPGETFRPAELATIDEDRSSLYAQINFANEDTDIRFSGNFGLRYVSWQITSQGSNAFGADDEIYNGETDEFLNMYNWSGDYNRAATVTRLGEAQALKNEALTAEVATYLNQVDGGVNVIEGDEFTRVLPSFNLKMELTEEFITRIAISESVFFPTLDNVRNNRLITPGLQVVRPTQEEIDAGTEPLIQNVDLDGYTANNGGNPLLQPELSTNYDLTFEWYYDDVGSLTTSFFYKRIRDYFRQSSTIENLTNSAGESREVAVTNTQNAGTATVQGYELAYQTTFGNISESLEHFGVQASYTFIDGSSTSNGTTDYKGDPDNKYTAKYTFNNINDLPLQGLSKYTTNLVLFYDNGDFQTRFAYNHRSDYLLNSRDVIAYAPVYGESTGQLDASMSYRINDMFKVGLEASNLLDEVTKTSIQNEIVNTGQDASYNQETIRSPRSYFANDRRFSLYVQATF